MADTYEAIVPYDGEFHTVSELTGITFIEGKTYTIQTIGSLFIKEGTGGNGAFRRKGIKEMQFSYRGEDLHVKAAKITEQVMVIIA